MNMIIFYVGLAFVCGLICGVLAKEVSDNERD